MVIEIEVNHDEEASRVSEFDDSSEQSDLGERHPVFEKPEITAYEIRSLPAMPITVADVSREWMDASYLGFPRHCLPLMIANQAGWFIRNTHELRAVWTGGLGNDSVHIRYLSGQAPFPASSHFGSGILTWQIPYLFRTAPGCQLLARGPANSPKDGIYPLEGIIETDWSVASFTMNWKFTRADHEITFLPGEPICMIVPVSLDTLEQATPQTRSLAGNAELAKRHAFWRHSRASFNTNLMLVNTTSLRDHVQGDYVRGKAPDGTTAPVHRTRLRLRPFTTRE